jgi:hypothetical protein
MNPLTRRSPRGTLWFGPPGPHPRGSALIELVIVMPVYVVLFFAVFLLGDMMWMHVKIELAARYAGWKRTQPGDVAAKFFDEISSISPRAAVEQSTGTRNYFPPNPPGESRDEELQFRQVFNQIGGGGGGESEAVKNLADIGFEGSSGHFQHGWVMEQRSWAQLRYNVVGFIAVVQHDFQLSSGCCVLQGKTLSTKMPPSGGTKFAFRDEVPQPTSVGQMDTPAVSGEEANMINVMDPRAP